MNDRAKSVLEFTKLIAAESDDLFKPPQEGFASRTDQVVANSLVIHSRGYIISIVNQINGAYENGWYDACAVMTRRLIETLIIEAFEHHNISAKIKNDNGDFFYLGDLVAAILNEGTWNIGRNTKRALPRLKDVGDLSAHSRRYIAHRNDLDKLLPDLRVVVQELIFLAGFDLEVKS